MKVRLYQRNELEMTWVPWEVQMIPQNIEWSKLSSWPPLNPAKLKTIASTMIYLPSEVQQVHYLPPRYPQNWAYPCPIQPQILIWQLLWSCRPQARGPQLTPRPLRPNSRILMSPKERNTPKKLGRVENPMRNYWFDLLCSAINVPDVSRKLFVSFYLFYFSNCFKNSDWIHYSPKKASAMIYQVVQDPYLPLRYPQNWATFLFSSQFSWKYRYYWVGYIFLFYVWLYGSMNLL